MSRTLTSSWLIISTTDVSSNSIILGLDYIYRICSKQNNQNRSCLKLFEHVLNLKKNGAHNSNYSESDFLRIVWSPIFELLFPPNQHNLIVKTGETISVMSQEHNQDNYKIDVVCGEVAKNDEDSKVMTDKGKLSRETKDAVDSILVFVETTAQAFSVQISGSTCLIATQQLTGNGLYVYHPAYSFSLPSCIEELGSFKSTVQKLISLQQHVITIANILEKAGTKKYSLNQQFDKHGEADKDGETTSILN
ncbi:hypothetical protein G6F56_009627 [Rhizopus delemar]|nr:hypothetical protein G6F56_009627 [Rhizopus delemar]